MNTEHLPFNMPSRSWSLNQNWVNLTFMHWEVEHDLLKKYIPEDLELERYDGKTYVGTIPFRMEKVRPKYLPSVPLISNFAEFSEFLLFLMEIERILAQKPDVFIAFLRGRAPELKTICSHSVFAPREVPLRNIMNS